MDQLTRDAEDMHVLERNLKEQERRFSPTSLLMPTQKFMRARPYRAIYHACRSAAQFIRIFVENSVHSESITEALDVY